MTAPARTRAAVLLAAALGAAVLTGCGADDTNADDPATPAPTTASTESAPTAPSSPATLAPSTPTSPVTPTAPSTDGSEAAATVTVPVYFVGDTPQGPRLYREFRQVAGGDPAGEALALMTSGDALDPDYRTLYPAGDFTGLETGADGTLLVSVADDAWSSANGLSRREAKLAVQQLVYTLQGVAQTRDRVTVQLAGTAVPLFGIDTAAGLRNAKQLNVLALVNLTAPEEGSSVSGTFTASGVASSFEGTVPWEIRDGSGAVVQDGFATAAGYLDKLYPWESEVDVRPLAPGTYTFTALTDDPSGGEGGGPTQDTKTITVG